MNQSQNTKRKAKKGANIPRNMNHHGRVSDKNISASMALASPAAVGYKKASPSVSQQSDKFSMKSIGCLAFFLVFCGIILVGQGDCCCSSGDLRSSRKQTRRKNFAKSKIDKKSKLHQKKVSSGPDTNSTGSGKSANSGSRAKQSSLKKEDAKIIDPLEQQEQMLNQKKDKHEDTVNRNSDLLDAINRKKQDSDNGTITLDFSDYQSTQSQSKGSSTAFKDIPTNVEWEQQQKQNALEQFQADDHDIDSEEPNSIAYSEQSSHYQMCNPNICCIIGYLFIIFGGGAFIMFPCISNLQCVKAAEEQFEKTFPCIQQRCNTNSLSTSCSAFKLVASLVGLIGLVLVLPFLYNNCIAPCCSECYAACQYGVHEYCCSCQKHYDACTMKEDDYVKKYTVIDHHDNDQSDTIITYKPETPPPLTDAEKAVLTDPPPPSDQTSDSVNQYDQDVLDLNIIKHGVVQKIIMNPDDKYQTVDYVFIDDKTKQVYILHQDSHDGVVKQTWENGIVEKNGRFHKLDTIACRGGMDETGNYIQDDTLDPDNNSHLCNLAIAKMQTVFANISSFIQLDSHYVTDSRQEIPTTQSHDNSNHNNYNIDRNLKLNTNSNNRQNPGPGGSGPASDKRRVRRRVRGEFRNLGRTLVQSGLDEEAEELEQY